MKNDENKLGTCDRGGCSKKPTHYVKGYAWGVPLVCATHAKEYQDIGWLQALLLT